MWSRRRGGDRESNDRLVRHPSGTRQATEAVERYRQAVETDPRYADAWNNLGLAWCQLGRRDEACSVFRRALVAHYNHPRAHYNLADTLEELGRLQEAIPHWQAYLRQDPFSEWGLHARSRMA